MVIDNYPFMEWFIAPPHFYQSFFDIGDQI